MDGGVADRGTLGIAQNDASSTQRRTGAERAYPAKPPKSWHTTRPSHTCCPLAANMFSGLCAALHVQPLPSVLASSVAGGCCTVPGPRQTH